MAWLFSSGKSKKQLVKKITLLEQRLQVAIDCLDQISQGNLRLSFNSNVDDEDGVGKKFFDTLEKTKHRLAQYSDSELERKWVAEGMEKFISLIQADRTAKGFYDGVLAWIVRYVDANQGAIFLLEDKDPENVNLEIKACYAYNKKKFVEKTIRPGQGILGQAFLEKETSVYTTVPDSYFHITSGLGEANPRFLIAIPLRYDHQAVGMMEIACFHKMEKFKVEFLERIAESLASVIINIQHAAKAARLYEESLHHARTLQEQEEYLRQNIEELESTQEEMKRHQQELGERTHMMKFIIDNIPFPIFVKDEKGRYTLVNAAEARLFNVPDAELLGKDDRFFVSSDEEWQVIQESDERVLQSDQPVELPIQHFTTARGASYIFKTTKIPFYNKATGKKNILGVSFDLTEKNELERKLLQERSINSVNTLINLSGRQRMLSQKIGFYAEISVKGKPEAITALKSAIDLFEHSLQVIKEGGFPAGIPSDAPLPKADASLLPYIKKIATAWQPYKEAANKIIYYSTFRDVVTAGVKEYELKNSIAEIENTAEALLSLNNDLMLACIQLNEQSVESKV